MRKAAAAICLVVLGTGLICGRPAWSQEQNDEPEAKAAEPEAPTGARRHSSKQPAAKFNSARIRKPPSAPATTDPSKKKTPDPAPTSASGPTSAKTPAQAGSPVQNSPPAPSSDTVRINPAGEYQPVIHARNTGITTCMDDIVTQSNEVIDRPHTAISTWVTAAPNDHAFESLIGLSNPSKLAPSSAAIIFTTPKTASKCEGMTVQVYPTAQPCGTVQASLIKSGRTIGALQSMPVIDTADGARNMLLPNASGGCVLVRTKIKAN